MQSIESILYNWSNLWKVNHAISSFFLHLKTPNIRPKTQSKLAHVLLMVLRSDVGLVKDRTQSLQLETQSSWFETWFSKFSSFKQIRSKFEWLPTYIWSKLLVAIYIILKCLTCWTSCFSIFAHNCCISMVTTSLSLSSTIFDWSCFSITKQFGHLPCNISKPVSHDKLHKVVYLLI